MRVFGPTYALLFGLAGVWVLCVPPSPGEVGFKVRLTGRALSSLVLTTLLGQSLWVLPDLFPSWVSPRLYTIWAVVQIIFLLVTTARVVDACHAASSWHIRALAVSAVGVWLLLAPSQTVGRFWRLPPRPTQRDAPRAPTSTDAGGGAGLVAGTAFAAAPERAVTLPMQESVVELWFRAMEARLAQTDPDQPVIFVAASGGGARAAMFTALVLEAMRNTSLPERPAPAGPPPAPSGDPVAKPVPSYQAAPTAPGSVPNSPNQERPAATRRTLADQIVLMSSVSGGSLATAYYVSQTYPHLRVLRDRDLALDRQTADLIPPRPRTRFAWRNSFPSEIYARMHSLSVRLLDQARIGRGRSVSAWAGSRFEEAVERVAYECERLAQGRNSWQSSDAAQTPIAPWLSTSAFVDDMSTDFMAPLLRGVLNPGVERGVSVTRFWEDQFGWRDVEDTDLHRQPHPNPELGMVTNGAPPILFNTCDVRQGTRLVLGFPPVPPGIIRDPLAGSASHLPQSLTDAGDLYYHVSLAEAVRLSANFPFGFEVAKLPLSEGNDTVLALDGGIVDNSGIDSIVYLLKGLDRLAKAYWQEWGNLAQRYGQATSTDEQDALWAELIELSCRKVEGRAFRLLGELARRKVVLIQIDSGAKVIATDDSVFSRLLAALTPVLTRPLQALNNASASNAELAIDQYDLELHNLRPLPTPPYDCRDDSPLSRLEAFPQAPAMVAPSAQAPSGRVPIPRPDPEPLPQPPLIARVRLTCNQTANIMTAWTLGSEDKARVLVQFLIEWEHQRPVVNKVLEIESRIQFFPKDPVPGRTPWQSCDYSLSTDYKAFVRGQKLVDRARAEFYQTLGAPAAHAVSEAAPTLLIDEAAKQDVLNHDRLFRSPSPVMPMAPVPPGPPIYQVPAAPAVPEVPAAPPA